MPEREPTNERGVYRYLNEAGEVRYGALVDIGVRDRKQKRKQGFVRLREAKAWRDEMLVKRRRGELAVGGDRLFATWRDQWLTLRAGDWSYGTATLRKQTLVRFAALDDLPIGKITVADVELVLAEMRTRYAASTVRESRSMLASCFAAAVSMGLIYRNPVVEMKVPGAGHDARSFWDAERVRMLLRSTESDENWGLVFRVIAETWMRVGELCGLVWEDVDFARGVVRIRRTARRGKDGLELGPSVKTAAGVREIPLSSGVLQALQRRRDRDRLAEGRTWSHDLPIFRKATGGLLDMNAVRWALHRACDGAGLPRIGPHMLRHAGASMGIRAGMSPKVVSERLGHKSVNVTLNIYTHNNEDDHRKASDVVAALLEG